MAVRRRSHRPVPLIEDDSALELRGTRATHPSRPAPSQTADGAGLPRWSTQRAGIASPHVAGDGLSGVTGDDGLSEVTSVPA